MSAIIFSHIFVSVFGAMAEFPRLSTMVIPVVLLLTFYFVDYAVKATKSRKVFCIDDTNSTEINFKINKGV